MIVGGPSATELDADPQARRLRALARRCGVADRVALVGAVPREEMARWYRSADLVVASPWYEPFGLTPLEAMACGVPVIATAVGGLIDTVADGVTGDLVPARDPAALGAAVAALLADRDRRFGYGAAAVAGSGTRYSWQARGRATGRGLPRCPGGRGHDAGGGLVTGRHRGCWTGTWSTWPPR